MPVPDDDPLVVAPIPTPFHTDDRVDYDALARNIKRWLQRPLSGFVLGTSNGEQLALSEDEKVETVSTVHVAHGGQRFIVAGIDSQSVTETLPLGDRFAAARVDLLRVRVP